jgi:hypothetical protein
MARARISRSERSLKFFAMKRNYNYLACRLRWTAVDWSEEIYGGRLSVDFRRPAALSWAIRLKSLL